MLKQTVNDSKASFARGQPDRPLLEASGGIALEDLAEVAATGVDRISAGSLTHSVVSLDMSLECG